MPRQRPGGCVSHRATLARWQQGASPERQWIIRHALRTLVKQGHPEALRLLGAEAPEVELLALELTPATLRIGETLTIAVTLRSTAAAAQQLVVDYVLHLPGARGARGPRSSSCGRIEVVLETRGAHPQLATGAMRVGSQRG